MSTHSLAEWLSIYVATTTPPSFSSLIMTTTTTPTYNSLSTCACPPRSAPFFPLTVNTSSLSQRKIILRHSLSMSLNHLGPISPVNKPETIQLNEESDFYQLLSPEGLISICGFGSLLSGTYNCRHHHHPFFLSLSLFFSLLLT